MTASPAHLHVAPPAQRRRGMTLLEVLIAIGLTLALLGSLFAFFHDIVRSREHVIEATAKRRAAATLIERLESDLLSCIAGDSRVRSGGSGGDGESGGAGVAGDRASLRVLTRGVAIHLAERGEDDPAAFGDLQLAEYRFSRQGGIQARRSVPGGSAGAFHPLGGELHRVRFRYHDGADWRDSFDSFEAGRLPVAVEVAVWFEPWTGALDDDDEAFDDEVREDEEPARERLTFDPQGTFDESAWARRAERDVFLDEPAPDRVRIIVVPDAREEEE